MTKKHEYTTKVKFSKQKFQYFLVGHFSSRLFLLFSLSLPRLSSVTSSYTVLCFEFSEVVSFTSFEEPASFLSSFLADIANFDFLGIGMLRKEVSLVNVDVGVRAGPGDPDPGATLVEELPTLLLEATFDPTKGVESG